MCPSTDGEGRGSRVVAARRALDLLGLAARAGAVVTGTEAVRKGVREGKVRYVVLAADASATQRKKLIPLLEARAVPHEVIFEQAELGLAVGRSPVSAVGLTSGSFARRAGELLGAMSGERSPDRARGLSEQD